MQCRKVWAYFNIIKKTFSIKDLKSGLVIAHSSDLFLHTAEFKVSEAGRQRVLKTKTKNVHAGILGYILDYQMKLPYKATYNPYKHSTFVNQNGEPVYSASIVHLYCEDGKARIDYADSIDRLQKGT